MDLAVLKCGTPNGWVFGWTYLFDALTNVHGLALLMRDLYLSRNNPVGRARVELLAKAGRDHFGGHAHVWRMC